MLLTYAGLYGAVRFAMEFPSHFRVMFMTPAAHPKDMTESDREKQGDPEQDGYAYLKVAVRAAIDAGRFRPELGDVELVAQTVWAAAHGVAAIQVAKADDPWIRFAPLERRVGLAIDSMIRGMLKDPGEVDRIRAKWAEKGAVAS